MVPGVTTSPTGIAFSANSKHLLMSGAAEHASAVYASRLGKNAHVSALDYNRPIMTLRRPIVVILGCGR